MVTYDTLFEKLRKEKNRIELQALEANFFLDESQRLMIEESAARELLSKEFSESIQQEYQRIQNKRKILNEFFERRARKILSLAHQAGTLYHERIIFSEHMTPEEHSYYDQLVHLISGYRAMQLRLKR